MKKILLLVLLCICGYKFLSHAINNGPLSKKERERILYEEFYDAEEAEEGESIDEEYEKEKHTQEELTRKRIESQKKDDQRKRISSVLSDPSDLPSSTSTEISPNILDEKDLATIRKEIEKWK